MYKDATMTTDEPTHHDDDSSVVGNTQMLRERYCSLLQRSLTRYEMEAETSYTPIEGVGHTVLGPIIQGVQRILRTRSHAIVKFGPPDNEVRSEGRDWPMSAETMVGMKRLDNLRECLEQVFADDVSGDVLEAGVWRGGSSIFMRGVIVAY